MRRADSLFARLFGVLLLAIVLAHVLAFIWFHFYGHPPPPPPAPPPHEGMRPPPPPFGGPLAPLTLQLLPLVAAAWYGAGLLSRPIQHLAQAALAPPPPPPPLRDAGNAEELFGQLDADGRGSLDLDELGSLLDYVGQVAGSRSSAEENESGLIAKLLAQYQSSAGYQSSIGTQLNLSA
jgi:hypothetical protein